MAIRTAPSLRRPLARWLFTNGLRAKRVARLLELNLNTVRYWEGEFDLEPKVHKQTLSTPEIRRKAMQLYSEGNGYRIVARRLGIPLWRAKNYLKSYRRKLLKEKRNA